MADATSTFRRGSVAGVIGGGGGDGVVRWKGGLQGGGELSVGQGTDGKGQVRSLSSSGQRYH